METLYKTRRIKKSKVYALGGVEESKFKELNDLGFEGVALLGAIWDTDQEPLNAYLSAKEAIKNLEREKVLVY